MFIVHVHDRRLTNYFHGIGFSYDDFLKQIFFCVENLNFRPFGSDGMTEMMIRVAV